MLEPIVESGVEFPMVDYSEILRDLRLRRQSLKAALDTVENTIRSVEAFLSSSQGHLNLQAAPSADRPTEPPQRRVRGELSPDTVAKIAREILVEKGRPLKRGELVTALEERGIPLAGRDKNKNLGTILWRHSDSFVSLDKLGYWPRDVALPGIYEPDQG